MSSRITLQSVIVLFLFLNSPYATADTRTPTPTPTLTATDTLTPTLTPWPYNPDLNGDNFVDDKDLVLMHAAWHQHIRDETATFTPMSSPTPLPTATFTVSPTVTRTPTPSPTPVSLVGHWDGFGVSQMGLGNPTVQFDVLDASVVIISLGGTFSGTYLFDPPRVGCSFGFSGFNGNSLYLQATVNTSSSISGQYTLVGSVNDVGNFTVARSLQ